jgi:hypothetical protein
MLLILKCFVCVKRRFNSGRKLLILREWLTPCLIWCCVFSAFGPPVRFLCLGPLKGVFHLSDTRLKSEYGQPVRSRRRLDRINTESITLEIGGGVSETELCEPQTHVPSDALLVCIIDKCPARGKRPIQLVLLVTGATLGRFERNRDIGQLTGTATRSEVCLKQRQLRTAQERLACPIG